MLFQAFEYHVTAELWLLLATCRGILWDSRVDEITMSPNSKAGKPSIQILIVQRGDFWLRHSNAVQHFASHKAVSKEQKYVVPLSNKYHLKLYRTLRSPAKEASEHNRQSDIRGVITNLQP